MNPIVLIPARMAATRLPGKPLADIGGVPMIVRVLRQAEAAGVGPVAVAAGDSEIVEAVVAAGGRAVLTDPDLPSGSDRIVAALAELDPGGRHDVVINLQGDIPFVRPDAISAVVRLLEAQPGCDLSTVMVAQADRAERTNPDIPKVVAAKNATRSSPCAARCGAISGVSARTSARKSPTRHTKIPEFHRYPSAIIVSARARSGFSTKRATRRTPGSSSSPGWI